MDKLLEKIIKADESARQRLNQAEVYRKEQMAVLPEKKEEIIKAENKKAIDAALKTSRSSETAAQKKLDEIEMRNSRAIEKMEQQYQQNHTQWEDTMLNIVLKG